MVVKNKDSAEKQVNNSWIARQVNMPFVGLEYEQINLAKSVVTAWRRLI
jgi:hypothetical protein